MPESRHRRNRRPRNTEIPPPRARRSGTNKLILVASIVIAVLVIGSFAAVPIFQSIGGPQQVALGTARAYTDGVGQDQEVMATKNHVDDGTIVTYNTVPATSGDHYFSPQPCGFYDGQVPDERVVHNLEHSNIIISYNLPNPADVDALREIYNGLEGWKDHYTVARPYPQIAPGQVALTAWGVLDIMDGVDEERIRRFYEHYVGTLGPEGAISCRGAQISMPGG